MRVGSGSHPDTRDYREPTTKARRIGCDELEIGDVVRAGDHNPVRNCRFAGVAIRVLRRPPVLATRP